MGIIQRNNVFANQSDELVRLKKMSLLGGKKFKCEITSFSLQKPLFAIIFCRDFFARPPTNTRVFPISGMIF